MNIQNHILKDGRKLSFCIYGKPDGESVFYFHGFPGSHLEVPLTGLIETSEKLNICLIAVNRPGYGDSDFQKNRNLLDWPDDISELADSLGINKFSVHGYSGGGPYALACAYKIPARLKKVVVVSGMGPTKAPGAKEVPSWLIIKWSGFMQSVILKAMKKMVETNPYKFHSAMNKSLPKVDLDLLEKNNFKEDFVVVLKEAFKPGIKGVKQDARIYKNHWGFQLKEITHPVYLWHGEDDATVKLETAKYISDELPNCIVKVYSNEGHLSLIFNKSKEIFATFLEKANSK